MKKTRVFVLLLTIYVATTSACSIKANRPPVLLKSADGTETAEFQAQDSVLFDAVGMKPRTAYTVQIADESGGIITESRLTSDSLGRIPETVIWYDVGIKPCFKTPVGETLEKTFTDKDIFDYSLMGKKYFINILRGKEVEKRMEFKVADKLKRPTLYPVDKRGCPKPWYLIGEEDIYVVGKNFPKNSIVRLWVVPDSMDWKDGDVLRDMTKQYPNNKPVVFELNGEDTNFKRKLWPKEFTSVGAYDIVAEIITYPLGIYRAAPEAKAKTVVTNLTFAGFTVQRRQGAREPLETDLSAARQSPLSHKDNFLTTDDVYVILNSPVHAQYVNKTADFYVVPDQTEAGWVGDPSLQNKDVTGNVEQILIWSCTNFYALVWPHPLTPGNYDIVMDFNMNGQYDNATDLIDSLDKVGFTVHASVPQPIVQPVCDGDYYVNVCTTINSSTVRVYRNGTEIAHATGNGSCVNVDLGGTPLAVGDTITAQQFHPAGNSPVSAPVTVTAGGSPVYDTSLWNSPAHQPYNNCYNYGCDIMTDTFAQPGEAHGVYISNLNCQEVSNAAMADGLVSAPDNMCSQCTHRIALVVAPGGNPGEVPDYHWYRLDRNIHWSHKPGGGAATELDASGNLITSPETANRRYVYGPDYIIDYNTFCGYLCVDKTTVQIH